jgi:hypothetical protein
LAVRAASTDRYTVPTGWLNIYGKNTLFRSTSATGSRAYLKTCREPMSKKICKKIREGANPKPLKDPKYLCKNCSALSHEEKKLCKPKKISSS